MELVGLGVRRGVRGRADRGERRGDLDGGGPGPFQAARWARSGSRCLLRGSPAHWSRRWRSAKWSASRSSCVRASSSAVRAPVLPTTARTLARVAAEGLAASPVSQILIERSIAGWKEFELEVMRDRADNCVVVCSIENFDPMGVHTGDSITVAPAQTLSDVEYQAMRDDAFACIRRVGVETGGSNIQFAVDPASGRRLVIEMNPRVSRSSALGLEGDRLPHRQDRRPPRRRLQAGRDPERHHRRHSGELRAHDRLRGDEGPAVGLREAARERRQAGYPHAVGG